MYVCVFVSVCERVCVKHLGTHLDILLAYPLSNPDISFLADIAHISFARTSCTNVVISVVVISVKCLVSNFMFPKREEIYQST